MVGNAVVIELSSSDDESEEAEKGAATAGGGSGGGGKKRKSLVGESVGEGGVGGTSDDDDCIVVEGEGAFEKRRRTSSGTDEAASGVLVLSFEGGIGEPSMLRRAVALLRENGFSVRGEKVVGTSGGRVSKSVLGAAGVAADAAARVTSHFTASHGGAPSADACEDAMRRLASDADARLSIEVARRVGIEGQVYSEQKPRMALNDADVARQLRIYGCACAAKPGNRPGPEQRTTGSQRKIESFFDSGGMTNSFGAKKGKGRAKAGTILQCSTDAQLRACPGAAAVKHSRAKVAANQELLRFVLSWRAYWGAHVAGKRAIKDAAATGKWLQAPSLAQKIAAADFAIDSYDMYARLRCAPASAVSLLALGMRFRWAGAEEWATGLTWRSRRELVHNEHAIEVFCNLLDGQAVDERVRYSLLSSAHLP